MGASSSRASSSDHFTTLAFLETRHADESLSESLSELDPIGLVGRFEN